MGEPKKKPFFSNVFLSSLLSVALAMSHARKHVTNKILTENPVPLPTERIVRVVEARGSNQYQVEYPNGQKVLCLRPSKFRNIVFIKRGDFLIIQPEPDDPQDRSKIRSIINHVLFPDHIRNLKAQNLWCVI